MKIYERVQCYFGDKNSIDKFYYQDVMMKNANTANSSNTKTSDNIKTPNNTQNEPKPTPPRKPKKSADLVEREFNYIDKEKLKNPGPGYYQSPPPKKPHGTAGIRFPMSKEFHSSYLRKEPGPGPADYITVPKSQSQKGLKFKTEGLYKSPVKKEFDVPGPGFYYAKPEIVLNRFMGKPPAFSFTKAKSQTPRNNNPGPLDYIPVVPFKHVPQAFIGGTVKKIKVQRKEQNTEIYQKNDEGFKKSQKGLVFGNEKRVFEFGEGGKMKFNVGPGAYEPKFEKIRGKSPGGSFGKGERLEKIKRSPGPGDYK